MDVKLFEYQQAMYQISAQEEGGVNGVGDLIAIWYLDHHPSVWSWIDVVGYLKGLEEALVQNWGWRNPIVVRRNADEVQGKRTLYSWKHT